MNKEVGKRSLIVLLPAALLAILLIIRISLPFVGPDPNFIGHKDGKLAPLPDKPNCVSSQATDPRKIVAPFSFDKNLDTTKAKLKGVIANQPRANIVKEEPQYLHVTFRTMLWGFVDDVEFLLNEDEKVVHIRSASRVGYGDLGMNRKRIEKLRKEYLSTPIK